MRGPFAQQDINVNALLVNMLQVTYQHMCTHRPSATFSAVLQAWAAPQRCPNGEGDNCVRAAGRSKAMLMEQHALCPNALPRHQGVSPQPSTAAQCSSCPRHTAILSPLRMHRHPCLSPSTACHTCLTGTARHSCSLTSGRHVQDQHRRGKSSSTCCCATDAHALSMEQVWRGCSVGGGQHCSSQGMQPKLDLQPYKLPPLDVCAPEQPNHHVKLTCSVTMQETCVPY